MKRQKFILALFISIFMAFLAQQTFAQKKPKSKIIELPTYNAKQKTFSFEITVVGEGSCKNPAAGFTCNWKIDRKYSGKVLLDKFMQVPFEQNPSMIETNSSIIKKKLAAHNSKWFTSFSPNQQQMYFDVNIHINDKLETKMKIQKLKLTNENKDTKDLLEEKTSTTTETWITDKPGKAVRYFDVVLNRQTGKYELTFALNFVNAKLTYQKSVSETGDEDALPGLPQEKEVFPIPYVKEYLQNVIIIPTNGNTPSDEMAGFMETFSPLNSQNPLLGVDETKAANITVTYKLK
jgi:hypothetical protein